MTPPDTEDPIGRLWDQLPGTIGVARAELLMELGHHLIESERYDEALPVVQTAEELYAESFDDEAMGRAAHNRAVILGRLDRLDEQLAAEAESVARFERAQRFDRAGCSRMSLAHTLAGAGRMKEALPVYEAARANFAGCGQRHHEANALMSLLNAKASLGRFNAAALLLRDAFTATTQAAPVGTVARLHELAAQIFEVTNGPEHAAAELRRARAIWDALDHETEVAACDIRTAVLAIASDSPVAAAATLQSLREERREVGDPAGVAACDRGLGLAALERHQPRQAERRFEDAATVFAACALFADAAECDALAARAAIASGAGAGGADADVKIARRLRRAAKNLERLHRPVAEVRARLDLAQLLLAGGDVRGVLREAKRAESVAKHGILTLELDAARVLRWKAESAIAALPARRSR